MAEERNRIARELHDVIGHSVSVMTVQASAVRRRLTPEQGSSGRHWRPSRRSGARPSPRCAGWSGCCDSPVTATELEPPPGLDQVDRLVEKFRTAGLPVALSVTGAAADLAPGLDLTAYRLVQEGLTNTLRHARNPAARRGGDRLRRGPARAGRPRRRPDPVARLRRRRRATGCSGMRERVAVYGGSLVAGPRPEGGFELVATLPLDPA